MSKVDEQIAKLKKAIDSDQTPDAMKERMRAKVEELEKSQGKPKSEPKKKASPKKSVVKKSTSKKAAKKEAKKAAPKKRGRPRKSTPKAELKSKKERKFVTFEGEKIYEDDSRYCERLLTAWKKRRRKAKVASNKYRTKSVTSKVAGDVADAVVKAVDSIPKGDVEKKVIINKIERVDKAAKELVDALVSLSGKKVNKAEKKSEFADLTEIIGKLKKKYVISKKKGE